MWQSTVFPGHLTSSWWLFRDKTTINVEGHTSFLAQRWHQESSAAVMAHAVRCSCSSSSIQFPQVIRPRGSPALSIQLPQPLPQQHLPVPHCPLHKEIIFKNQPHSPGAPVFKQHDEQVHTGCISCSHGHGTLSLLSKLKSTSPHPWFAALSGPEIYFKPTVQTSSKDKPQLCAHRFLSSCPISGDPSLPWRRCSPGASFLPTQHADLWYGSTKFASLWARFNRAEQKENMSSIWTKHIFWLRKVWRSFGTSWALQRVVENHSGSCIIWNYLT